MSRDLQFSSRVALSGAVVKIVHLVELHLDEPAGVLRLCDAPSDLEWEGNTYIRGGNFLSFSDVEETAALMVNRVTVGLAGVDQALLALVLSENYIDRTLRIYRGFLDTETNALKTVESFFEGRIDRPSVAEDPDAGTSTVQLSAASVWVDFERRPGRRTNHEQQQQFFPGDLGFQYAAQTFRDLPWGRS